VARRPLAIHRSAAIALAAAFVFGCRPGPLERTIALRLIDEDPQDLFDPSELYTRRIAFEWTFPSAESVSQWEPEGIDEVRYQGGALALRSANPNMQLRRLADFDAAEIDTLEVDAHNLVGARVAVEWAGPTDGLSAGRRLVAHSSAFMFGTPETFRFDLAEHPGWRGRIRLLRLRFAAGNREVLVRAVRGIEHTVDPERWASAARKPRKVEIDHEVRSVFIAHPTEEIRREVEVPREGSLEFGWGLAGASGVRAEFEVSVVPPYSSPQTIFAATLGHGPASWHDERVSLTRWQGERVTLVFRVTGDWERGAPVWANPRVLGTSKRAHPNVVLVSLDTLRADRLSLYGYHRATSPRLDAWARRRGVVFQTAVASAPWTLPAHASMFTGLDAASHGVNHYVAAPGSLLTLAERLRGAGYMTIAITAGGFLRPELGLTQGFDRYRYRDIRIDSELELRDGIAHALRAIDRYGDRPLFLFFHTYEVHSPHISRQPYLRELSGRTHEEGAVGFSEERAMEGSVPGAPTRLRARSIGPPPAGGSLEPHEIPALVSDLYDSGIAYADHQLGQLLDRLDQHAADQSTVAVITSDHGEMLGEHGQMSHATLYDENLLVPLVVAAPDGRGAGLRIEAQVRQVDILPTILELAGLPAASGIDGESLTPFLTTGRRPPPRLAWSYASSDNVGLALRVDGRFKYVLNTTAWRPYAGREVLYRLDRDPGELHDASTEVAAVQNLRRRSRELLDERARGLRIRLQNPGSRPVRGALMGYSIRSDRVKSWDLTCHCLELDTNGGAGIGRFTIPPGGGYTLLLEAVEDPEVALKLESSGLAPAYETRFRVGDLTGAVSVVLEEGRWKRGPGMGRPGQVGVSVWWHDDTLAPMPPPPAARATLDHELRALGYLR
jgi:arylsulfatase A-like enzyme